MPHAIVIAEYDPRWAVLFDKLHVVLDDALGNLAVHIHHVGSTAVPGLDAKPILDIDIEVAARNKIPAAVERLTPLGYVHVGDGGIPTRERFDRIDKQVPWTSPRYLRYAHHLYACASDSPELARHLAFRDHLRSQPEDAAAYSKLKLQLAEQFGEDRDGYAEAKTEFITDILSRAASV